MPSLTVNGNTLHYEESGQGTPIVLMHGFPLDSRVWTKQRERLSDRFRVITPDLRGFGQSPSIVPFTLGDLAEDVHLLLAQISARPCVLGGLSMGGYVTLEYARRYPTDLRAMLLIDTKAEGDTPEGKQGRDKMIELVQSKGSRAVADAMMPKMLAPHAEQGRPSVARELRTIMEHCPPLTIEHALLAMRDRNDHRRNLPSISIPVQVIVGEMDAITPPMAAEAMAEAIPRSEIAIIKGAGHMSPMEQPDQVTHVIRDFAGKLA